MKKNSLKKIIIFYPSFERGGVENILLNLIRYFLKKRVKIVLISSNIKKNVFENKNLKLRIIKVRNPVLFSNRINKALLASKLLQNELKNSDKKNTIVLSLQGSSLAIIVSKIFGFKIIVRNAEDAIASTFFAENKIQSLLILFLKIVLYNFSDKIITNSKGSGNSLKKIFIKKKKIFPIYNPYLKSINYKHKKKKYNYLLSVGRLTKQKDFHNLIISYNLIKEKIPNYKLIIVGDGHLKKKLKIFVNNLGLKKKIIFTGWKKNIRNYYLNSKLFILNSLYEGFGNVLIDAINYNLPIITTNCKSGPEEIIDYGKGGFLVPVNNPVLLSKKILFCLNNYKIAIKKTRYAKKHISKFSCKLNCEKYFQLICKTINE
ncbi:glycosyltransferase [Candidatus Pelagibacter sp.]|nr:glycosyltransferase [Candidatus Pelagibacter sp.]